MVAHRRRACNFWLPSSLLASQNQALRIQERLKKPCRLMGQQVRHSEKVIVSPRLPRVLGDRITGRTGGVGQPKQCIHPPGATAVTDEAGRQPGAMTVRHRPANTAGGGVRRDGHAGQRDSGGREQTAAAAGEEAPDTSCTWDAGRRQSAPPSVPRVSGCAACDQLLNSPHTFAGATAPRLAARRSPGPCRRAIGSWSSSSSRTRTDSVPGPPRRR